MMEENKITEKRRKIIQGLEATYAKLIEFKKSKKITFSGFQKWRDN